MTEYDIHKRTFNYSRDLLKFTVKIPRTDESLIIKRQLIRSGTSIGANVAESNGGNSKKDFANFMNIALKSANETSYWLKLLAEVDPALSEDIQALEEEVDEIRKIIGKICVNSRK